MNPKNVASFDKVRVQANMGRANLKLQTQRHDEPDLDHEMAQAFQAFLAAAVAAAKRRTKSTVTLIDAEINILNELLHSLNAEQTILWEQQRHDAAMKDLEPTNLRAFEESYL